MQKTLLAFLLISGITISAGAQQKQKLQKKDVPAAVQSSFKTEFPDAKDVEWKMKDSHYKADFEVGNMDHIAGFDSTGKLLWKGMEINKSELPAAITAAVQAGYAGRSIDDVYKVDKDGVMHYLVELNGNPETKILYSADGQVVKEK